MNNALLSLDQYETMSKKQRRKLKRQKKNNTRTAHGQLQLLEDNNRKHRPIRQVLPKNEKQKQLLDALKNYNQVICVGPAGSGKTYLITATAANLYLQRKIDKIIVTRSNVSTGKSLGFFPGDVNEKMLVWTQPVVQVLKEFLGQGVFDIALKKGDIVLQPLETIRGMSFSNSFIIADEAQNISADEIKALLTRIGEDSTVVLNGDILQKDLKDESGLEIAIKASQNNKVLKRMTGLIEFGFEDIVRSKICKEWVKEFYYNGDD